MERDIRIAIQVTIISAVVAIEMLLQWLVFHSWEISLTLSGWLLAFTIAYWADRTNTVLNSILIAAFLPMAFIVTHQISLGVFYDILHLPTLLTGLFIIFSRSKFRVTYVIIFFNFFICWGWFVWTLGFAYQYFSLWFMVSLTFIGIVNIFFSYALARYKGYLLAEGEESYTRLLEEIRGELGKLK